MSDEQTPEITINLPGPDAPGYLRRLQKAVEIRRKLEDGDWEAWHLFGELLISGNYVTVSDGSDPKEAIQNLSFNELSGALSSMAGGGRRPVDPPKDA